MKKANKVVLSKEELAKFQQILKIGNSAKQLWESGGNKDEWQYKIATDLTTLMNTIIDLQEKSGSVDLAIIGQYFIDIIDNIPLKELSKVSIEFTTLFSLIKDVQTQIKDVKQQMQSYEELTNLLKQYDSIIKQIQQADKDMHDETQPTSMNTINYTNVNYANDNTDDIADKIKLGSIENVLYQLHEDEWHSKEDILQFIKDNNLTDILVDAPEYIREVFGDDIKLALELEDDPEENWTELWIIIKSNYTPEEAIELELKLLHTWWKNIKDKVRDKLNYMCE